MKCIHIKELICWFFYFSYNTVLFRLECNIRPDNLVTTKVYADITTKHHKKNGLGPYRKNTLRDWWIQEKLN